MSRALPTLRLLIAEQSGVVFTEFLVAFVPVWTFFLCVVQLAFVAHANLVVKHAADSAARSAVVVLPDDPSEYGGEPKMSVARNRITAEDISRALAGIGTAVQSAANPRDVVAGLSDRTIANLGRSRLNTIRLVAHIPLMAMAPVNVGADDEPSIAKSIGTERRLLSSLFYQPFALAVTFPGVQDEVATGPEITARVTYAFQCTVPLARQILCESFLDLSAHPAFDAAFVPLPQQFIGGRFRAIEHETTLLIHDAPYEYRAQSS